MELIGLLPAAGHARRMGHRASSKELTPVPDPLADGPARTVPAARRLLRRMSLGGARRAYVVLRAGKWDIPQALGSRPEPGLAVGYLATPRTEGAAYTLDQAYPLVRHARVLLGFPDVLFHPDDAFATLAERQTRSGAEVVLGLFPTDRPSKMDMVAASADCTVERIHIKPSATELRHAWLIAAWGPAFTDFLHTYLQELDGRYVDAGIPHEIHVGEVIRAAMGEGMRVTSVTFASGRCLDIGTPEDLGRVGEWG